MPVVDAVPFIDIDMEVESVPPAVVAPLLVPVAAAEPDEEAHGGRVDGNVTPPLDPRTSAPSPDF